jgi:phospholipid/cholesterol/gamma-HCH transport system substrate-binding protein
MKGGSAAIKVGITVILIALITFLSFQFVAKGLKGAKSYAVWAHFHDATGLANKSRVQIAGLNVGEIGERRLEGNLARVTIKLLPDVVVYSNAAIFKKAASLLGEYYLEIDPGTPESVDPVTGTIVKNKKLEDGDQIKNVIEAVTTGDILIKVNETLPVLREILLDVQKVTRGPLQDIAVLVRDGVKKNSDAAEKLLKDLDKVALDIRGITGGKPNEDLRKTMENVRDISAGIRDLVGIQASNKVGADGQPLPSNQEKLAMAIDNLNATLANVRETTAKVNKGEGTVGRLLNDDAIANNVEQITEDVGGFVRSITRLQTLVQLRSEYNVIANTLKTYVAVQLQSRPDKFFLIELIDDPRGTRAVSRSFTTTDDPSRPQTVVSETVTTQQSFRFSFQIGKKLFLLGGRFNLTGRFGIKESTGGAGLDIEVPLGFARKWARNLEFRIDLFDFRSNTYPRLKILAAFEFFKHLWIVGGVDDILNDRGPGAGALTGRDYFFGAMLTFNDDDLRGLLTIGGAALIGTAAR